MVKVVTIVDDAGLGGGAKLVDVWQRDVGTLDIGDTVNILYDPDCYEDVRTDAPIPQPLNVLAAGGLCLALGGIGMAGQAYLRGKYDTPWNDWRA